MADEEKKTSGMLNLINPKGKKATTPKKTTTATAQDTKDAEAKAKVQELLKNTTVASLVGAEKVVEQTKTVDLEEIQEEKSVKWLQDQLNLMNRQVEEQEQEIMFYKNEIQRLQANQQAGGTVPNQGVHLVGGGEIPAGVVQLFRHFEKVYEAGYDTSKIVHPESGNGVLDKMQQFFPELANMKRYRYRQPQPR
jgi:hypothetical protein